MKASDLIKELQEKIKTQGDLPVAYQCKHWWWVEVESVDYSEHSLNEGENPMLVISLH